MLLLLGQYIYSVEVGKNTARFSSWPNLSTLSEKSFKDYVPDSIAGIPSNIKNSVNGNVSSAKKAFGWLRSANQGASILSNLSSPSIADSFSTI